LISDALTRALAEGQRLGAIGPSPIRGHIDHAAGFAAALAELPADAKVLDIGSGAGLPGLVIAELLPTMRLTLLEGRDLRADRLESLVGELGLGPRVEVVGLRAEVAGQLDQFRGHFDAVVARGFGRPAITAECGAPFLHVGGLLVVSEPPDPEATEHRWPAGGCALLGLRFRSTVREPHAFVTLTLDIATDPRYPRRTGVPEKRPLF